MSKSQPTAGQAFDTINDGNAGPGAFKRIPLAWEVGHASTPQKTPERWVPATVPGAVQLDWARAENWPPYWQAKNFTAYRWMEDVWWTYRTRVPDATGRGSARLFLVCRGIDYHFSVHWNGRLLHEQEGMFRPCELDLTDLAAGGGVVEIRIRPAPKAPSRHVDRTQARLCAKPPVSYGWDWHPRLIPLGIWQDAYLEVRPAAHLLACNLTYALDAANRSAHVSLDVAASHPAEGHQWRWSIASPAGSIIAGSQGDIKDGAGHDAAQLAGLELWWPWDHGSQPLYVAKFELLDPTGCCLEVRTMRTGFRRVKLVPHEGAWEQPAMFPKSRTLPPITLEVNGRRIFGRGSNWVPPEIFPGTITADTYRPLLRLACDAHMNILRCWGGGIVNKDEFFDLCDESGLLVWQEFPLACNLYEDDPGYLGVLDAESRFIVRHLRHHPCLAIWSGGNELFNVWSGMTDQSLALRLLNRNCLELDPATPFLPTSPVDGMGHGDYRFRDEHGREVHQIFAKAQHTAYTEFGCPGPSPVAYLKRFIPESELWPPQPGSSWEAHHAFGAWNMSPTSWLCLETLQHYFGASENIETLVARGEWLQGEGYKVLFEEARRQKPRSSMALNWCFNEPWPSAANNSIINWPAEPKPAFHAVAASCRPVMASARLPKFSWFEDEEFEAELWLFNDSPHEVAAGGITAEISCGSRRVCVLAWSHPAAAADRHVRGPVVRWRLPAGGGADRFMLHLVSGGAPERNSVYTMPLKPAIVRERRLPGEKQLP